MKVLCANCRRPVEDEGKDQTCEHCGTSPVPSYSYGEDSPFHPENCDCAIRSTKSPIARKRKVPLPKGPKL